MCGIIWKQCQCPWFNYDQVEADRLNHFNVAVRRFQVGGEADQPRLYQEELDRRRQQEREDEALARRLQGLNVDLNEARFAGDQVRNGGRRYGPRVPVQPDDFHRDLRDALRHRTRMIMGDWERNAPLPAASLRQGANAGWPRVSAPAWPSEDVHMATVRAPDVPLGQNADVPPPHYDTLARARAAERVVPQQLGNNYAAEYVHGPPAPRLRRTGTRGKETRRQSMLAGLTRNRGEGGRIGAWLQHVEDGHGDEEVGHEEIAVAG